MSFLAVTAPLLLGWIMDRGLGDPPHWPHPVKLFGKLIALGEGCFNQGRYRFLKGMLMSVGLVAFTWWGWRALLQWANIHPILYYVLATIGVFWGLANRCLQDEVRKVERVLQTQGLEAARQQLSFIVGRDTSRLNAHQVRTAGLETLSENLSDGVVAPLFYYALGGVPLMMAYKMINTLDSMIGYKQERYRQFGHFAARVDDVANYLPARITAVLMIVASRQWQVWGFVRRYGSAHASPNAGYPEAALAGILNCRFGGPNIYHGQWVQKPFIGNSERELHAQDVQKACAINEITTMLMVVGCMLVSLVCLLVIS